MKEKERLERLDDDFVEAILAMTPEEAMDGIIAEDLASMRSRVSAAAAKVGRTRLARARTAAAADANRPRPSRSAQGAKALNDIRANDAAFNQRLTLAARNGGADYEEDRASIEADLEELRQDEERGDRD
jgi:hypothetical protein